MPAFSRNRFRKVEVDNIRHYRTFHPGGALAGEIGPQAQKLPTSFEQTNDVVGSSDEVHPCLHNVVRVVNQPRPNLSHPPSGAFDIVSSWYEVIPTGIVERAIHEAAHVDLGELADLAYEALYPQVPQEVSIPNFLYELREILALLPKLQENITQTVSGGYLNYQFGWKPFIGDLQKLTSLMSTVRARLEYLRETWGRETRISYQRELVVDQRSDWLDSSGLRVNTEAHGLFRCSGYLYHELQDLHGLIAEFRALSGATGFSNPLGVLWESIPYSFVVDWFSRVGSLVNRTPIQPFVGPWEIRRLTYSIKIEGSFTISEWFPDGLVPAKWDRHQGTAVYYTRGVGLPVSSSILYEEGLNPQQQALAAALLGARHR